MSCDCTEKISQLIDGELSELEARAMQRHLNDCLECQQARTDFLSLRSEISSYIPSLNPAAQSDALSRIVGRQRQPVSDLTSARPSWTWIFSPRALAFATVILLVAIAGFVAFRALQQKEMAPARIAETTPSAVPTTPEKVNPTPGNDNALATIAPPKSSPAPAAKHDRPVRRIPRNVVAAKGVRPEPTTDAAATNNSGDIQALTAMHLEKSELLLRAFRNVRTSEFGSPAEIDYERKQAQQLILRNMMLRREADTAGDVQIASLLENLEPILLDIANLPSEAHADDIRVINDRVERKNIVALLQVNSTVLARAMDDD